MMAAYIEAKSGMRRAGLVAFLLALALAAGSLYAMDDSDDEDEDAFSYEDKLGACVACHGEKGDKPTAPNYPVIAGQYADYLEQALKAYRSGHRQEPIMAQQVEIFGLTDDDIEKLAAHFAGQPGLRNLGD